MKDWKYNFKFIHSDGLVYEFHTETNELNNCQMYWYTGNGQTNMYYGSKKDIKQVIENIESKCTIISEK